MTAEGFDVHYCKHCDTSFRIQFPARYTGDALIVCMTCHWEHSRQFEAGIAVSCDPPTRKPIRITGAKP